MIRAQWVGGPKDGDWINLDSPRPITVLSGDNRFPERRRVVPRKLNHRWILDFYSGKILKEDE